MRPELEIIERIEQYLKGELSPAEKAAFEKQIEADPLLKEEVNAQQDIMRGIERADLKERILKARKSFHSGKSFTKWGLGGLSLVVIVAAILFYKSQSNHRPYENNTLPEFNEQGEKQWADADKHIPAQTFIIDATTDTVIETKGGIVMAIPANGFLDENGKPVTGKVDLAVKEALDPATMINGGLSTKSGNELLESGGMFFIDARKNGKSLKINPANGIYTEIPAKEIKPGMQMFSGKRNADGTIDWVAPKPLEHDLVPVDIKTLNFYPPNYLDSLSRWGYDIKNKQFTDSLYYSFASRFPMNSGGAATPATDSTIKDTTMEIGSTDISPVIDELGPDTLQKQPDILNGKQLFQAKCASCHNVFKNGTGPSLGGIFYNDFYQGDIKKLMHWFYNTNALVNAEPHYKDLKNRFGSVMTQFSPSSLSEQDVRAIFDYIDNDYICGINPAKIKAIWNEQFQNTFVATREFEERLEYIHYESDPALLDLYLENLDKPLYYIDSMAALKWRGAGLDASNMFELFAARRDGKVKTVSVQFDLLRKYYQNKTKAFTEAIAKTQSEFWEKQEQMDIDASVRKTDHTVDSSNRISQNFAQEFDLNLKEAYRQLGYDTSIPKMRPVPATAYGTTITSTGWCNVDRYVFESTTNRTTLDYTDPQTGKKAVIKYNPVSIQVNQWNEYERLYVYLLPNQLNSFMRVDGGNGKYSEKLNELMTYDLVCVGYKDEQAYYYSQKDIHARDYSNISLSAIEKDELSRRLNTFSSQSQVEAIKKENDYFQFEIKDLKRQRQNTVLRELTQKIRPVIFPCLYWGRPADSARAFYSPM